MNTKELKSTKLYKEYSLEIPYKEIDIEVDKKINQILKTFVLIHRNGVFCRGF